MSSQGGGTCWSNTAARMNTSATASARTKIASTIQITYIRSEKTMSNFVIEIKAPELANALQALAAAIAGRQMDKLSCPAPKPKAAAPVPTPTPAAVAASPRPAVPVSVAPPAPTVPPQATAPIAAPVAAPAAPVPAAPPQPVVPTRPAPRNTHMRCSLTPQLP